MYTNQYDPGVEMEGRKYSMGIDAGTTYVKSAIINNDHDIIGSSIIRSGTDHTISIHEAFHSALAQAGLTEKDLDHSVATGFARNMVPWADSVKSEISCHSKGAYHYFPERIEIIDIGGQDTKIIKVNEDGKRTGFRMNRKCAAGTGAFLEEISRHLEIPLNDLSMYAQKSNVKSPLSSFCTVFASTEILKRLKDGEKIEDLINSAYESIAMRVLEMEELQGTIVMTGGVVAHHPIMARIIEDHITGTVNISPNPQLIGAIGAALYASKI